MPESKTPEKAEEKPAEAKKPHEIETQVWAPAGGVAKNQVISAAINSVRDAIPVVFELNAEIVGAKKAQRNNQQGTEFTVKVSYTPREMAGGEVDEVNVDAVVKGLEVPTSVDGIHGVEGDPDFLKKTEDPGFPTK